MKWNDITMTIPIPCKMAVEEKKDDVLLHFKSEGPWFDVMENLPEGTATIQIRGENDKIILQEDNIKFMKTKS